MTVSHSSVGGSADEFQTTHWTLVFASAHQSQKGRAALASLCQIYWYPLYAFARRRGYSPPDAQDLTQGFFLDILEHRALSRVDRLKGKFRSFLLACFQKYLSAEIERAHRLKRGGQCEVISLDLETAENRYRYEPVDYLTAEKIFEASWAFTLLEQAMIVLREEYVARGKESVFDILRAFDRLVKPPTRMEPRGAGTRAARGESMTKAAGFASIVHRGYQVFWRSTRPTNSAAPI